jgi:hypothetical protein
MTQGEKKKGRPRRWGSTRMRIRSAVRHLRGASKSVQFWILALAVVLFLFLALVKKPATLVAIDAVCTNIAFSSDRPIDLYGSRSSAPRNLTFDDLSLSSLAGYSFEPHGQSKSDLTGGLWIELCRGKVEVTELVAAASGGVIESFGGQEVAFTLSGARGILTTVGEEATARCGAGFTNGNADTVNFQSVDFSGSEFLAMGGILAAPWTWTNVPIAALDFSFWPVAPVSSIRRGTVELTESGRTLTLGEEDLVVIRGIIDGHIQKLTIGDSLRLSFLGRAKTVQLDRGSRRAVQGGHGEDLRPSLLDDLIQNRAVEATVVALAWLITLLISLRHRRKKR